ncbi:hypothetical protein A9Q93_05840 [Nonlabens dokdonensis]|uniref:DUF3667 domain-containing protein n=1 Tax=Nonlabens dokdonensis TaxID=328515 RepID=A0A1Z8B0Y9_9FLAO|nr:DUF3667 domain-containing protein [Nonlabens dokdonensis]OUS16242.1 hypothetical protein A9Q93_05840 [Nonlabens dokdonensis]
MNKEIDIEQCKNCGAGLSDDFCPKCGNPKILKRIDGSYILSEMVSVLNFDKGIFYTIKELFVRPGKNVHKFIHNDRNRLVKPIIFIIVCSLIYTVVQQLLKFEDGYANTGGFGDSAISTIFVWIQKNYGYSNVLMSIFIAVWIKLFFKKYNYNFFEIIILLCFVMGIGMLIYTTFGILESIIQLKILQIGGIIGFIYTTWAIGQFFDKKKFFNYLKGLIAYLLGMITFYFLAVILGLGIDLISEI